MGATEWMTPAQAGGARRDFRLQPVHAAAGIREPRLEGPDTRSTAKLYNKFPIPIPFLCPLRGHDYVGTLSCRRFKQICLGFRRDRIAQPGPIPAKPEKVRVHNPLGNAQHLARHLILWVVAVPA
jgi:hypothetical protein